jgi:hypothetical protein
MNDAFKVRKEDFEFWLSEFSILYSQDFTPGNHLHYSPECSTVLNESYWILREKMKEFMFDPQKRINYSKIIAGVQTIILHFQPFESPIYSNNAEIQNGIKNINSLFVWNVSIKIMLNFF